MTDSEQTPPEEPQEAPKIIADDDWKAQAQAEKERLAREVEAKQTTEAADQGAAGPGEDAGAGGPRRLPPASFATLVSSLATQTFLALGAVEDPQTKRRYVDLDLAKHHIDTLAMLEEKVKGNLDDEETHLLDQSIYECRMQYVNIAQRLSTAPPPPGAPGQ